jgi:hypothetical protein
MNKLKLFAAVAELSTPGGRARNGQRYQRDYDNGYRDRGPVGAAVGIAGAAVGTAAAVATSPFRDSYAYDKGATMVRTVSLVIAALGLRAQTVAVIRVSNVL